MVWPWNKKNEALAEYETIFVGMGFVEISLRRVCVGELFWFDEGAGWWGVAI